MPTQLLTRFFAILVLASLAAPTQANPLENGWTLDASQSMVILTTVKEGAAVENSAFSATEGSVTEDGTATLRIKLDSIDTGIDARNVRMRYLLFQTFRHPEAVATVALDPTTLATLPINKRETLTLPFTLSLNGTTRDSRAWVNVALLEEDRVSVSTLKPIPVKAGDFGLLPGITKLEEAAGVTIVPTASITFSLVFERNRSEPGFVFAASARRPQSFALESERLGMSGCADRLATLSDAEGITFAAGSAALENGSLPILTAVAEIIARCPAATVEVSGHTDADGSAALNQRLSEARAAAVAAELSARGVAPDRLQVVGYGEARPRFPNDTRENKRRNRRIEFAVKS